MDNKQAIEHLKRISIYNNLAHWEDNAVDKAIASLEAWDKVKEQILEEKEHAYSDFDDYKMLYLNAEPDELPFDDFRFGMERTIEIINKHLEEIEE